MKLQDAYVSEKGDSVGSWMAIGYQMYNNTNFEYLEDGTAVGDKGYNESGTSAGIVTGKTAAWAAKNKASLNDCAIPTSGGNWTLDVKQNGSTGGSLVYKTTMGTNCETLTPSFSKLNTDNSSGT